MWLDFSIANSAVYIDVAIVALGLEALKQYDSQADHRAEHQCGEGKNRPGWRGFVIRFRLDETKATQQTYGQKRYITPDD